MMGWDEGEVKKEKREEEEEGRSVRGERVWRTTARATLRAKTTVEQSGSSPRMRGGVIKYSVTNIHY